MFTIIIIILAPFQLLFADGKWDQCIQDNDCIKVRAHCDSQTAINKKYKLEHEESTRQYERLMQCVPPTQEELEKNKKMKAQCEKRKCRLVEL